LDGLINLSVDERRTLNKMGDKSESFCRQTLVLLGQNPQVVPPGLDLAEAQRNLTAPDALRKSMSARFARSPATSQASPAGQ
jgi:hypothetical protein